jgi:hypothetical protein
VAGGEEVELDPGGTSLSLRVADDMRIEVEVEVDGDEYELELGMVTSVRCLAGARSPGVRGRDAAGCYVRALRRKLRVDLQKTCLGEHHVGDLLRRYALVRRVNRGQWLLDPDQHDFGCGVSGGEGAPRSVVAAPRRSPRHRDGPAPRQAAEVDTMIVLAASPEPDEARPASPSSCPVPEVGLRCAFAMIVSASLVQM